MWGNAGSGGSRTASLGDALASCAAHASEKKKKAGPDLPVLAYANRATTGNRVRACFVGYGTAGCATPAGVLHARTHSSACTQKRGPSVDSREPTGAERLISYRFWKKRHPVGTAHGVSSSIFVRNHNHVRARHRKAPFRGQWWFSERVMFLRRARRTQRPFRPRPVWRTGYSLSRLRTRVADSMHPVLR